MQAARLFQSGVKKTGAISARFFVFIQNDLGLEVNISPW